nr:zinc finger, CCHC-type [Tanacetum cinerariifolium]
MSPEVGEMGAKSETTRYSGVSSRKKLTGPNFIDWYRQLRLVLSTEYKENYLEHLIHAAPVAPPGQQVPPQALAAHAAWVKGQKKVVVLMLLTMDLEIQRNLAHLGAYDMLQELKAMYSKQVEPELLQIVKEFHTSKQEEGKSVSSHVLKMKGYIDNLERLDQPVGQNLAVSLILVSLNKDFDSFVQNYNMHGMGKTVNKLHAMLKLHEETLPKKDVNPGLHAIRAGRNPPPPKKDNPAKDAICHQCGKVGHWRRNCPVYLAELMKKKKLSQGASTSGSTGEHPIPAAPVAPPGQQVLPAALAAHAAWVKGQKKVVVLMLLTMDLEIQRNLAHLGAYDMLQELKAMYSKQAEQELLQTVREFHTSKQEEGQSVSSHVLKMKGYIENLERLGQPVGQNLAGLRGSKKLKPGALNLYVGDGHRTAVEAIRTFHLELPSGLVIVLNNCHYAPSITRASGSVEDLELIQEEDTNPLVDTSLNHGEDDQEINEPQSDISLIRDLGEPAHYKAALLDPESKKWLDAMNVEMQSMK